MILFFTRFLFKKVIFHFHAAGLSEELPKYNKIIRSLIYYFYKRPDLAITSSEFNPKDAEYIKSKDTRIIPLGVPDEAGLIDRTYQKNTIEVLFVGLLNTTKGEGYLVDAIKQLVEKGHQVSLKIAGKFENEEYKQQFFEKIKQHNIQNHVHYLGVITGEAKRKAFINADIFCFPSFFVSESFGIVLLEAMQYKMPIIATKWRGIQSIVKNKENGFLVDIQNSNQLAEAIEFFINNRQALKEFGETSRKIYEDLYTLPMYLNKLGKEFLKL